MVVVLVVLGYISMTGGIKFGASSGPEHYNYEYFKNGASVSRLTTGGGIITVATTSNAYTMTAAELASGNVISIADTATSTSVALALTLPATSTMTTLIPSTGDSMTWMIQNLHTAAATTTTITAGTGIELQGITANDDIINGAGFGSLSCYRQASRDVVCVVKEFVAAD